MWHCTMRLPPQENPITLIARLWSLLESRVSDLASHSTTQIPLHAEPYLPLALPCLSTNPACLPPHLEVCTAQIASLLAVAKFSFTRTR